MKFITRAIGATRLLAKAHAPTIMVIGGVTSMGVGTVVACRKTLKIEQIIEPHVSNLERIENAQVLRVEGYTEKDAQGDRYRVYGRVGRDMVKLYFVPGVLFFGGVGLVFGGHRIMLKRNATLAIALTTVTKAFDTYRSRAREVMGEDFDRDMMAGRVLVQETNAKGEVVGEHYENLGEDLDPYNRVFSRDTSSQWEDDLGVNNMFVSNQQRMANHLLVQRGHLYLSDVYKSLGIPESDLSRVVGWKVNRLPDGSRDIPFVSFGLDKIHPDDATLAREHAIYLDFNCHGLIVGGRIQKILENA